MPIKSSTSIQAAPPASVRPLIGMHGERVDWISARSQLYHLGHGARSYDPMLQGFLSKDPYSPFGMGGVNPYAFCGGDPVNRTDPSGHASAAVISGVTVGVLGLVLGLLTLGISVFIGMTAIGALLAATSGVLGLASSAVGIAASVHAASGDPELARTLGWVATGLGIASMLLGLLVPVGMGIVKATGRLYSGTVHGEIMNSMHGRSGRSFLFGARYRDGSLAAAHINERGRIENFQGIFLPPELWADDLARIPAYQASPPDSPLYLMVCQSTHGGAQSPAAIIARTLQREVLAIDSPYTVGMVSSSLPGPARFFGTTLGRLVRYGRPSEVWTTSL